MPRELRDFLGSGLKDPAPVRETIAHEARDAAREEFVQTFEGAPPPARVSVESQDSAPAVSESPAKAEDLEATSADPGAFDALWRKASISSREAPTPEKDVFFDWVEAVLIHHGGVMKGTNLATALAASNGAKYHARPENEDYDLSDLLLQSPRFLLHVQRHSPYETIVAVGEAAEHASREFVQTFECAAPTPVSEESRDSAPAAYESPTEAEDLEATSANPEDTTLEIRQRQERKRTHNNKNTWESHSQILEAPFELMWRTSDPGERITPTPEIEQFFEWAEQVLVDNGGIMFGTKLANTLLELDKSRYNVQGVHKSSLKLLCHCPRLMIHQSSKQNPWNERIFTVLGGYASEMAAMRATEEWVSRVVREQAKVKMKKGSNRELRVEIMRLEDQVKRLNERLKDASMVTAYDVDAEKEVRVPPHPALAGEKRPRADMEPANGLKVLNTKQDSLGLVKRERDEWQRQHEATQLKLECCVCLDATVSILLFPCRHLAMCAACAANPELSECPTCRTAIEDRVTVYF